ncbi:9995_t:CDS:2, partial [Funneliformis geosporum]
TTNASTKAIEEKDARILAELSRKYNTAQLIEFLQKQKDYDTIVRKLVPATRNLELSPVLKEMNEWQVPYTNYFEIFVYKAWSISHYEAWVFKYANKRSANVIFYKSLNLISRNQQISQELRSCALIAYVPRRGIPQVAELGCVTTAYAPGITIGVWSSASGHPVCDTWTDVNKSAGEKRKSTDTTDITITKVTKKTKEVSTSTTIPNLISTEKSKDHKSTDLTNLKEALITFFKSRSSSSLSSMSEAVLQAVSELLLPDNRIPELCLIIDSNKQKGDGRFGFVDLIFGDINYSIIELKYINLLGLIKAMNNNWHISPSTSDLVTLDKYIENEDEGTLLERKFMFWSKSDNEPKCTTLNEILLSAEEQVTKYMNVISHGQVKKGKSGIIDSRILIKQPSNYCGVLDSHVIMMIGFRRLICRFVGSQNTFYSFMKKDDG